MAAMAHRCWMKYQLLGLRVRTLCQTSSPLRKTLGDFVSAHVSEDCDLDFEFLGPVEGERKAHYDGWRRMLLFFDCLFSVFEMC